MSKIQRQVEKQFGVPEPGPDKVKIYIRGSKENMYEIAETLELSEEAKDVFAYTAYEVELDIRVHRESGRCVCVGINGVDLFDDAAVVGGIPV